MSRYIVKLKEPRPGWWHIRARRTWDKKLTMMQALVDSMPNQPELEQRIIDAYTDLVLYGEAIL